MHESTAGRTGGVLRTRLAPFQRLRAWLVRPKSIGFFLSLLIAATIIPALGISGFLLKRNDLAQRQITTTLASAMAGSIAEAVDRDISGMITTLRIMSTTPALTAGDMPAFYSRAKTALAGTNINLVLLDENYQQLMDTAVAWGTPLGPSPNPSLAEAALSSRAATVSGLFFGVMSQKWIYNVMLPLLSEGQPKRLLVMTQDAQTMEDALSLRLSQHLLLGGWNAALLDRDNIIISYTGGDFETGKPFFLPVTNTVSSGTMWGRRNNKEEAFLTVVDESVYSGWKVVVWAPVSVIEAPMRRTLWLLLAGSLVVIAIGTGAAIYVGRKIARPVRRLAIDARRLGAGEPVTAINYPIAEVATVSIALAEAAKNRKQTETEVRLLMREVAHRAKNQLTVVSSMAKQTARHARSLPAFLDSFQKRLYGLARSTDLLIEGGVAGVELRQLVSAQIEPFQPDDPERLELRGPLFRLSNQAAQTIGLAIHELATNASKYGAFSTNEGSLSVSWAIEGDMLMLRWAEDMHQLRRRLSPRRGFGTEIIERMVGGTLDAEIERNFLPRGLECIFRIPVARIAPDKASHVQH